MPEKRYLAILTIVDFFIELHTTIEFVMFLMSARNAQTPGRVYTALGPMYVGNLQQHDACLTEPLDQTGECSVSHKMPLILLKIRVARSCYDKLYCRLELLVFVTVMYIDLN